jgi:uncharacterized protein
MCLMVTQERADEVGHLSAALREWAKERTDVVAIVLVGSWARGDARMDSDVDVVLLTDDQKPYLEGDAWLHELGGVRLVKTRQWGPLTERRFALSSGLEVELGVAPAYWASTDPVDEGTRRVVADGAAVVYDPEGLLARLVVACSQSRED